MVDHISAPRNIKPPTLQEDLHAQNHLVGYPEEFAESQDTEEAPNIEEVEDAKQ